MQKRIMLPLTDSTVSELRAGDRVLLSGVMYVARDAAHKLMVEALDRGDPLPFDMNGQTIYFMGPTPARPGRIIGSAGPTTSGRMGPYSPRLIAAGLKGVIGKGALSRETKDAIKRHRAVYFAAVGGAGALLSKTITKAELVAYRNLGAEAILRIEVAEFPATVINDIHGNDLYEEGKNKYRVVPEI